MPTPAAAPGHLPPELLALLAMLLAKAGNPPKTYPGPARSYADVYGCRACPCGGMARPGNPCVRCGAPIT